MSNKFVVTLIVTILFLFLGVAIYYERKNNASDPVEVPIASEPLPFYPSNGKE